MKTIKKLEDPTPDPENANEGTLRGSQLLERSLEKYGAGRSIVVDKNGLVIAGNKSLEQAVEQGLKIRVVRSKGDKLVVVQREDLDLKTQPAARELAYMDNRTAEMGLKWNTDQIAKDLARGVPLGAMFTDAELAGLLEPGSFEPQGGTQGPASTLTLSLHFDDQLQHDQWIAFLAHLEIHYPGDRSIASRLDQWITDQGFKDIVDEDEDAG